MSLRMPETVSRPMEGAGQSGPNGVNCRVGRAMSLTGWANSLVAGKAGTMRSARKSRDEGVYIVSAEEVPAGGCVDAGRFQAPDGYVRQSPVQEIAVPPDYHLKRMRRWVLCGLAAAAAGLVVYLLIHFGIIRI